MRTIAVQDVRIALLAPESSEGGRGKLFEQFVARLLADQFGFQDPTTRNLNVTSDGIELDVVAEHALTGAKAIAECKAYQRNVSAADLTNFYGKLTIERFSDPAAFGLFCALPRLTADGGRKGSRDPG